MKKEFKIESMQEVYDVLNEELTLALHRSAMSHADAKMYFEGKAKAFRDIMYFIERGVSPGATRKKK